MNRMTQIGLGAALGMALLLAVRIEPTVRGQDKSADVVPGVIDSVKLMEPNKKDPAIAECSLIRVKHKEFPGGEVRVCLTKKTKLEKVIDGKRQPAKLEDLKKGTTIHFSEYDDILEAGIPIVYAESVVIQEAKK